MTELPTPHKERPRPQKIIAAAFVFIVITSLTIKGLLLLTPPPGKKDVFESRDQIAGHIRDLFRSTPAMLLNAGLDPHQTAFNEKNPNEELKDCLTGGGKYCLRGTAYPMTLFDTDGVHVVAASKVPPHSSRAPAGPWQYFTEKGDPCDEPHERCALMAQTYFVPNCAHSIGDHCEKDRVEIDFYFTVQGNPSVPEKYGPIYAVSNDLNRELNGSTAFWVTSSTWVAIRMANIPGYYGNIQ